MLELRVYGQSATMTAVAEGLDVLAGVRHVSLAETGRGGPVLVTADVRAEVADAALAMLDRLGVASDDAVLLRQETIGPVSGALEPEPLALVWADLPGRARKLAVGVAISVTTIPAAAFLGVAVGIGDLDHSLSALGVLGANVVMMLVGGASALAVQRAIASR